MDETQLRGTLATAGAADVEFEVVSGGGAGTGLALDGALVIGREGDGPGRLEGDDLLSRRHARLSRGADGRVLVEDLGSSNGTFVNGERIAGARAVSAGDVV